MEPKKRECNHCHNEYEYKIDSSKFCSDKCRVAYNRSNPTVKEVKPVVTIEKEKENSALLPLNGLPPQAAYIVHHQEKEIKKLEDKIKELISDKKTLQEKFDSLKEEHKETEHKQALGALESTVPTWYEKLLQGLPPSVVERIANKLLPDDETPTGLIGTDGQLDGESTQWAQSMVKWFSGLPKEGQHVAAGLVGELTKVPGDKLNDVVIRMINILQNGTTIKPEPRTNYGGF